MLVKPDNNISIYFGDATTDTVDCKSSAYKNFCQQLTDKFHLQNIFLQHQTHGLDGMIVRQDDLTEKVVLFKQDGDWLATKQKNVGIGILTGDCLPIVLYDKMQQASGIAHAGWKGTFAGIAQKLVEEMRAAFHSKPEDLVAFFGPSARSCCYEVGPEFEGYVGADEELKKSLVRREEKLLFDKACYNTKLLLRMGLSKQSFNYQYHVCTICYDSFHSYRRSGQAALRQMTLVFLK